MHIVINGWFVGNTTAGSGQYIDHMLGPLSRLAPHDRFSLLLPAQNQWPPALSALDNLAVQPLTLPPLPRNLAKLYWEQVITPRAARRFQADLLWVPYWAAPLWQPCPTTVTIHDLIPRLLPAYRGGVLQRAYTRLVSLSARRAARVIAVSHASARDIVAQLAIEPQRVHPIHHGPNQPVAEPLRAAARAALRAKYALPSRYFLYLGGFDVRKNVRGVMAAYRRYLDLGGDPGIALVVAGRLPAQDSDFAPDPRQLAHDAGILEHVHFCGWVADEEKPGLYAMATAYLFPSEYEGFGMPVLEAMAAGTPVVTSSG